MALRIVCHQPGEPADDVYRFRYDVYEKELGWESADADHATRRLRDELDDHAVLHSLADGDRIVGTLRTVYADRLPDLALIEKTGARAGAERFGPSAVVTTGRFMLTPELRGGTAILRLIRAAAELMRDAGVRLNYGDASPHLLPFYEHLGYRRFQWAFNDEDFGWKFPILMIVRDQERLARVGSPLRRIFADEPDDVEARAWFESNHAHSLEERSQRFRGREQFAELVRKSIGSLEDAHLLGDLTASELHDLFATATIVTARAGDEIIRQGESGRSLHLFLSGAAAVVIDGEERGVLTAGELVGEMAFRDGRRRTASIVAVDDSQVVVLDGERTQRLFERDADLGRRMSEALARIAAGRSEH